jgi:hypothetical protein
MIKYRIIINHDNKKNQARRRQQANLGISIRIMKLKCTIFQIEITVIYFLRILCQS